MTKNSVSSLSQEPYIIWLLPMVHMCQTIISLRVFQFFKILIFQVFGVVEAQKTDQNDKKFCPTCSISQEPYIIWLLFMVHIWKMIISPDIFFFFFKILGTLGGRGKKAKNGLKLQNILSVSLRISGTVNHDYSFWHMCVKWWYLWKKFPFYKILILGAFRRVKGQKMT